MASAVIDLVALSLIPLAWRRDLGPQLRSGQDPADLLAHHVASYTRRTRRASRRGGWRSIDELRLAAAAIVERSRSGPLVGIPWSDPDYPPALAAIADPPPMLWARGDRAALGAPAVAIVGSRAGSSYALTVAEHLAADLAPRGVVVVSGLARGVDSAAHRGALGASGRTVAVLGSGVDVIYPREHTRLADAITADGLLISELAPGTPPHPYFFPLRNRIISGLSRAVVVVEAGERSGSLITARSALEQGRDVLAVPGSVLGGRNRGGHALIRDGARIVETAADILEELGWPRPSGPGDAACARREPSHPLLQAFTSGEPTDLDALADRTGLATARLLPALFELELQGRIRRLGGGRFVRVDRSC